MDVYFSGSIRTSTRHFILKMFYGYYVIQEPEITTAGILFLGHLKADLEPTWD